MLQKRGRINRNCRGSDKSLPLTIIVIDKLPHGSMFFFIPYVPSAASGTSFLLTAEEKEAKKTATPQTPT